MTWMKRALTTIGLAASLAGCGAASTDAVRQHGTVRSIPEVDWSRALTLSFDIEDWLDLPSGYATMGYLGSDANRCRRAPCYDMVVESVDTSGEGDADYIRVTIDTRLTNPEIFSRGPRFKARAIFHDENHDGEMDYAWVDDEGGNPGYDGRYDRDEPVSVELHEYILNLLEEQQR